MRPLSDSELGRFAEQFRRLKELAAAAEAEVRAAQDELLAELERRNVDAVAIRGLRITKVIATRTAYDAEAAKVLLKPSLFRKVTHAVVEKAAFEAHVTGGYISPDERDAIVVTLPSAPYVRVSGRAA